MKIDNFIHDEDKQVITFEIVRKGIIHEVEVKKTERGTSYTDYDDFTEEWEDSEYNQLEEFVSGCSSMLHKFWHN